MKRLLARASGFLVLALTACITAPGASAGGMGTIRLFGTGTSGIFYMLDEGTRTCWLTVGEAVAPLDCCRLQRVPTVATAAPWVEAECTPAPGSAAPAPAPAEPPAESEAPPVRP